MPQTRILGFTLAGLSTLGLCSSAVAIDAKQQNDRAVETAQSLISTVPPLSPPGVDLTGPLKDALEQIRNGDTTAGKSHDSPQLRAVRWLSGGADADTADADADAELVQRYALSVLYFSTGGDGWDQCSQTSSSHCEDDARFLSEGNVCTWFGVSCTDEDKKGFWLDLSRNGLKGSIPDELSLLHKDMQLLWLAGNEGLTGTLPTWIGAVAKLQALSVFDTSLGGTLPDSLYKLPKLTSLRLYGSKFEGTLSTKIGEMKELSWLWIHGNEFTGTIPSDIGRLKKLEGLTIHGNRFGANIDLPDEICDLRKKGKKLEHLWTDCEPGRTCTCCTRCFPGDHEALQ